MELRFSEEDEAFRAEARAWLAEHLRGRFAELVGRGGPTDGDERLLPLRRAWERTLADGGWTGLGWPPEHGGRGASLVQQVIWNEEYARARAPGRFGHIGEQLLAPGLIAFGSDEQKRRFLPAIRTGDELWCQGYSEPNAGSDLANVQTRAERRGGEWVITGQKIWTSRAQWADWCFALCRTEPGSRRHHGLSYLLVPMKQPGITVRPIRQMTGTAEFNEVFFDGAVTAEANVLGGAGGGWKVAMHTLGVERGVSTLAQQLGFANDLDAVIAAARAGGAAADPHLRRRIADAWIGLQVMRLTALRTLGDTGRAPLGNKLYYSTWHRSLGELAMDVLGPDGDVVPEGGELTPLQRLYLFTRADTIYAGSSEIQRNIIGERGLGLPPEPRP
jgi:alkylation response protein AidB-like acyl-CoA dehydrogenase